MIFRYTILYVEDVSETVAFYCAAFEMTEKMIHESGDYGEVETGETVLAFASRDLINQFGKNAVAPNPAAPTFEIAFETDDVAAGITRAVDAGATLVQAAEDRPWGQTIGYVSDNNGFRVELCTPVDPPA